jgi:glycogen synthase kinase 3 beta
LAGKTAVNADRTQVFRKAPPEAIDLISALLEYTPTQRLSAVEAMCHPFFDELRDPATRFPDSRHPNNPPKDLPALFNFSRHGECTDTFLLNLVLVPVPLLFYSTFCHVFVATSN